jgi:hypothetical protein
VELDQRESSLRQQLQSHQAASAKEAAQLTAEVARLTHELDLTNAQVNLLCYFLPCQANGRLSSLNMCAVHDMLLLGNTPAVQALLLTQANALMTWFSVLSDIKAHPIISAMQISAPWVAAWSRLAAVPQTWQEMLQNMAELRQTWQSCGKHGRDTTNMAETQQPWHEPEEGWWQYCLPPGCMACRAGANQVSGRTNGSRP